MSRIKAALISIGAKSILTKRHGLTHLGICLAGMAYGVSLLLFEGPLPMENLVSWEAVHSILFFAWFGFLFSLLSSLICLVPVRLLSHLLKVNPWGEAALFGLLSGWGAVCLLFVEFQFTSMGLTAAIIGGIGGVLGTALAKR